MKRIFLGFSLCTGMLFAGMTNASALVCHDDPTLGIGTPVTSSISVSATVLNQSVQVNTTTTKSSTSFSAGFSIL